MAFQISLEYAIFFATATIFYYLVFHFKRVQRKNQAIKESHAMRTSTEFKTLDLGVFATIRFAWKLRTTLWGNAPNYEQFIDILHQHKSKMIRCFFLLNWSSSGRIVATNDLETTKDVFRSSTWLNRFHNDHYFYIASFGKPLGILFGNDNYWKVSRKAVIAAFRDTNLLNAAHIEGLYQPEVNILLDKLRRESDSSEGSVTFCPQRMFDYPIIHVVFRFLFGRRLLESDPLEGPLMDQLTYNNHNFTVGLGPMEYFPFLKYFPSVVQSYRDHLRLLSDIYEIIRLERDRRLKEQKSSFPRDIMDSLLKTVDEHSGTSPNYFTFENLQVTLRDLILAGSDTTNVTLQHMILFMATHQDKQQKVYDEIDCVVGHERWPTYEDRKRMVFTQAMLLETLRLGGTVPASWRVNSKDCTIGDLTLKKGTYMVPAYIAIHRSPDIWDDPLVFRPERFISDDGSITNTDRILPFACGPRACPGELNGRIALFMFTVTLLREFKWEPSEAHPTPSILNGMKGLSRSPIPYFVRMTRRKLPFYCSTSES